MHRLYIMKHIQSTNVKEPNEIIITININWNTEMEIDCVDEDVDNDVDEDVYGDNDVVVGHAAYSMIPESYELFTVNDVYNAL
mmetsp:Transcript_31293/g.50308  ORF Transcript_31293/g.50308 Transcript_31293/m.50308 type:complete len:83 (-) Transcript_31293:265-513(-)